MSAGLAEAVACGILREVPIARVVSGDRLRSLSEEQVKVLMASIADVGLLNPITVYGRDVIEAGVGAWIC
jgi:ParB-like chromosome segregation protein Spo0J